jgi:hypothetical protein
VNEEIEQEVKIRLRIILSYTITDPLTMMIHFIYTYFASPTMVIPGRLDLVTNLAYEELILRFFLLSLIFICNFFENSVGD